MTVLTVAAVQRRAARNPRLSALQVEESVAAAAESGAHLVVFPEATMVPFGATLASWAQPLDGPFAQAVRRAAARWHVVVSAGMFTPGKGSRVRNTTLVTDGRGLDAAYHKIHLFDALGSRESDEVEAGTELVTVDALGTRLAVATCYDLRFPAQFTELGRQGAEVILVGASWGDGPGKLGQWQTLTRARAMDAAAYLVAADQPLTASATHPLGIGHSTIVHPSGLPIGESGEGDDILVCTIELGEVTRQRHLVPTLATQ
ncbi:MAG: nitrilase-related carbon-nitrogen hydrolase [Arachnia sp.]